MRPESPQAQGAASFLTPTPQREAPFFRLDASFDESASERLAAHWEGRRLAALSPGRGSHHAAKLRKSLIPKILSAALLLSTTAFAEKAPTKPKSPATPPAKEAPASPPKEAPAPTKPPETEPKPADLRADPKIVPIARALEAGYGKLFEGVTRNAKQQAVVQIAGQAFLFDDGNPKTPEQRIDDPDVKDMFLQVYPLVNPTEKVEKDFDPGRARVEDFFKALYGGTEAEVRKNLTTVNFCGTKVQFNSRCGAADALAAVGKDLDALFEKHPEMKDFTRNLAGTFQWRFIAGTKRLSNHSFGTAIDLNVDRSAYWRWAKPATMATFSRKTWPTELIETFERHGFIWGGKWWHYDTMHFEFRPELIAYSKAVGGNPPPATPEKSAPAPKPKAADLLVPLQGESGSK